MRDTSDVPLTSGDRPSWGSGSAGLGSWGPVSAPGGTDLPSRALPPLAWGHMCPPKTDMAADARPAAATGSGQTAQNSPTVYALYHAYLARQAS
eukprot:scaffold302_cov397-Prasinococcus_capsulatus_cf.AAC.11